MVSILFIFKERRRIIQFVHIILPSSYLKMIELVIKINENNLNHIILCKVIYFIITTSHTIMMYLFISGNYLTLRFMF